MFSFLLPQQYHRILACMLMEHSHSGLQPEFNEIGTGPNMNDYLIYTHGRMRRTLGVIVFYTTTATWTKSYCSVSFTPSVPSYLNWMLLQHVNTEPATSINEIGTRPNMNGVMIYTYACAKLRPFLLTSAMPSMLWCMVPLPEFNKIGIGSNVNVLCYICVCNYMKTVRYNYVFVHKEFKL